jgi:hypothetical protein
MRINMIFNSAVSAAMRKNKENRAVELSAAVTDAMRVMTQFIPGTTSTGEENTSWGCYFNVDDTEGVGLWFGDVETPDYLIRAVLIGVGCAMSRLVEGKSRYSSYEVYGMAKRRTLCDLIGGFAISSIEVPSSIVESMRWDDPDTQILRATTQTADYMDGGLPVSACIIEGKSKQFRRLVVGLEHSYRSELQGMPPLMLQHYVEYLNELHELQGECGPVSTIILDNANNPKAK